MDDGHPENLFTRPPWAWFSFHAGFRRASAAHFCVIPYSRPPFVFAFFPNLGGRKTHFYEGRQAGMPKNNPPPRRVRNGPQTSQQPVARVGAKPLRGRSSSRNGEPCRKEACVQHRVSLCTLGARANGFRSEKRMFAAQDAFSHR